MIKKVTIDYEKLCEELNRQGKTKQGFSLEIGRGKDYIVSIKHRPEQPENMESLMCRLEISHETLREYFEELT